MNELDKLINKYQESIKKIEENLNLLESNFPIININQDILAQFNINLLLSLENLLNKLSLSEDELNRVKEAFSYYRLNQDLNLSKLIVRDSKCIKFIETIRFLYNKIIEYKESMINNYQNEIEKLQEKIKPLDSINGLFQNYSEININNLMTILTNLEIDKDTLLEILTDALNRNLEILQTQKKEIKENPDKIMSVSKEIPTEKEKESNSDLNVVNNDPVESLTSLDTEEENQNIKEIIKSYDKKIEYLLSILLKNQKKQADIYLIQSRLVELKTNLLTLKEDYELCNDMLQKNDSDEYFYLLETKNETIDNIQTIIDEVDAYAENILETEEIEEEVSGDKKRNLIFLNSSFKDIENFKKDVCQINIIKKAYLMLKHLTQADNLSGVVYKPLENYDIPVNELKGNTSKGTPRIFYQIIDKNVIILLMGIEGKHNHYWFTNTIKARTNVANDNEYKNIVKILCLSESKPNDISPYNPNLTNKEYASEILTKYQEIEQEFFEIFHQECYNPDEKRR